MKAHYDPLVDFDPKAIYNAIIKTGEDWADKNSAYQLLKETRDSVRSNLEAGHLKTDKSAAAAKVLAMADEIYREHVKAMVRAQKEADKAKVRYEATRVLGDMRRTQVSLLKEQVRNNS